MMEKYMGWESLEEVKQSFFGDDEPDDFPTDDEIVVAWYESGFYECRAFVLFRRYGKLFEVNAWHCSCCDVEGQWNPEETSVASMKMRKPTAFPFCDEYDDQYEEFVKLLDSLQEDIKVAKAKAKAARIWAAAAGTAGAFEPRHIADALIEGRNLFDAAIEGTRRAMEESEEGWPEPRGCEIIVSQGRAALVWKTERHEIVLSQDPIVPESWVVTIHCDHDETSGACKPLQAMEKLVP